MSAPARVVLLVIGNELLNGEVRDSNLFTLARDLTRQGFKVEQAAMVRDDPQAIAALLVTLLKLHPDVIIISGGLGPTADDCTLAAVADALKQPLVEIPTAREMVNQAYSRLLAAGYVPQRGPEEAQRKMARLPLGAKPLLNPVGVAPGVWLEAGATTLICLPGVPEEMEALLEGTVTPQLTARFGQRHWAEHAIIVHCEDEANITKPLQEIAAGYPDIYIKSLAQSFPKSGTPKTANAELRIIVATHAADETQAQQRLKEVRDALQLALSRAGIPVLRTES
ncbi:MAG: competence/damage-inducible protein A [Anaerolineae bacterium]|nr:competence/damage-inducible protein A [Anaerolineae bacterium]